LPANLHLFKRNPARDRYLVRMKDMHFIFLAVIFVCVLFTAAALISDIAPL